jgi:hypothetical protein
MMTVLGERELAAAKAEAQNLATDTLPTDALQPDTQEE